MEILVTVMNTNEEIVFINIGIFSFQIFLNKTNKFNL